MGFSFFFYGTDVICETIITSLAYVLYYVGYHILAAIFSNHTMGNQGTMGHWSVRPLGLGLD